MANDESGTDASSQLLGVGSILTGILLHVAWMTIPQGLIAEVTSNGGANAWNQIRATALPPVVYRIHTL